MPWPGRCLMLIEPPCEVTIPCTTASPSPVPSFASFVVKNGKNTLSSASSLMRVPVGSALRTAQFSNHRKHGRAAMARPYRTPEHHVPCRFCYCFPVSNVTMNAVRACAFATDCENPMAWLHQPSPLQAPLTRRLLPRRRFESGGVLCRSIRLEQRVEMRPALARVGFG